jgi:tight adherence protein C
MLSLITSHLDVAVSMMSALSAFFACVVVSWPYLARNTLGARMRQVADQREFIRVRERTKSDTEPNLLLTEPKQIFRHIFERMNLSKHAEDSEVVLRLRMAGYRGHAPVVTFVAVRLIMPFAMFALAVFYLFVMLNLAYPLFVKLGIALIAAYLGFYAPRIFIANRIAKRQKAIRRAWPDALDLLLICVESGMGIETAFQKVSEEIGSQCEELAEELGLATAELSYLPDRRQAFKNLADRTGLDAVKAVVTSLLQADKYGTSLGQSLRVLAQESRDSRMAEAEKKAAALPPKLTVPMILFFLPVLFAVIITPAVIQIMKMK